MEPKALSIHLNNLEIWLGYRFTSFYLYDSLGGVYALYIKQGEDF